MTKSTAQLTNGLKEQQEFIGNYWIPVIKDAVDWLNKYWKASKALPGVWNELENNQALYAAQLHDLGMAEYSLGEAQNANNKESIKMWELRIAAIKRAMDATNKAAMQAMGRGEARGAEKGADGGALGFVTPGITAKETQKEEDKMAKDYNDMLHKQYEATAMARNETDQIMMYSYDYEMQLIEQKSELMRMANVKDVDIARWASAQRIEAINKELKLQQVTDKIVDTLAIGSAEERKYLIADILEAEMLAQSKKFAWMAVEKLLMLDFAGAAIAGAEALALGYGASVIHAETDLDKSRNKEAAAAREAELNKGVEETGNITVSSGGGGGGGVTTIERAAAPTIYNINNSYKIGRAHV